MTVDVEVICIGNELLIGKIRDTNAHYLASQITKLGANLRRVTVIQDAIGEIGGCLQEAVARKPQFIITTGGLGPTFDDMTLQGIAQAFKRKLQINQEAVELVKQRLIEYLKKRGLPTDVELTPPRIKMALLPEGSKPVNNPLGTAPGVRLDVEGTVLFVLPGVPREAEAIFNETIAPLIKQAVGNRVFCERSLFVDGLFESVVAPLIDKIMGNNLGVYVKSHTKPSEGKPHLELHLTINVDIEQEPAKKLCKAAEELAVLIEKCGGQVQGQV